jgi:adenylate cyclase
LSIPRLPSYFSELKRRSVFRVAALYAIVGWILIQVATSTFPYLQLPPWLVTAVIVLVVLGFPIALVLAWAYDITPDGVRRTEPAPAAPRGTLSPLRPLLMLVAAVIVSAGAYSYLNRTEHATASAAGISSLAVLPFADMSPAGDQAYFADGIAEELLDALSRLEGLRVPSRTSSFIFRQTHANVREVGRALNVDAVLQGSVRKAGTRVKVTAQLIDARTDTHLWSSTWNRELRDIFAVQEEIARSIVQALGMRLSHRDPLMRRHVSDLSAYELYMRGRSHLLSRTRESTLAAVDAFEEALARDPAYALAHAGLALAAAEMHLRYAARGSGEEWGGRAMRAAHRALDLDAGLGEAHEALAAVFRKTEFDWGRTIEESRRAIELAPSLELPYHYMAAAAYHLGLMAEAETALDAAEALSPVGNKVELLRSRGMAALFAGRFHDAVRALEEAHRRSDEEIADWNLAFAYYYVGETARSEAMLRRLVSSSSASTALRAQATLAGVLAASGAADEARALLRSMERHTAPDHHVAYGIGVAHAQLREHGPALYWLERAAETGLPCHPWYAADPLLEPLRSDPQMQNLLERLRLGVERDRARYFGVLTNN